MKRFFLPASIALLLCGCNSQPQPAELLTDMVVLTQFDPDMDYTVFSTYTMPMDTIGLISNVSSQEAIVDNYSKMVTSAIKKNMTSTNRQLIPKSQDPDLGINAFVINDQSVYQTVSYPNYGYGGYGGGYGYGYGGYGGYGSGYGYVSTHTISTGILVIQFADLKSIDPQTNKPPIIWSVIIGDVINSYDSFQKTVEAIDQAFVQSPYLDK